MQSVKCLKNLSKTTQCALSEQLSLTKKEIHTALDQSIEALENLADEKSASDASKLLIPTLNQWFSLLITTYNHTFNGLNYIEAAKSVSVTKKEQVVNALKSPIKHGNNEADEQKAVGDYGLSSGVEWEAVNSDLAVTKGKINAQDCIDEWAKLIYEWLKTKDAEYSKCLKQAVKSIPFEAICQRFVNCANAALNQSAEEPAAVEFGQPISEQSLALTPERLKLLTHTFSMLSIFAGGFKEVVEAALEDQADHKPAFFAEFGHQELNFNSLTQYLKDLKSEDVLKAYQPYVEHLVYKEKAMLSKMARLGQDSKKSPCVIVNAHSVMPKTVGGLKKAHALKAFSQDVTQLSVIYEKTQEAGVMCLQSPRKNSSILAFKETLAIGSQLEIVLSEMATYKPRSYSTNDIVNIPNIRTNAEVVVDNKCTPVTDSSSRNEDFLDKHFEAALGKFRIPSMIGCGLLALLLIFMILVHLGNQLNWHWTSFLATSDLVFYTIIGVCILLVASMGVVNSVKPKIWSLNAKVDPLTFDPTKASPALRVIQDPNASSSSIRFKAIDHLSLKGQDTPSSNNTTIR